MPSRKPTPGNLRHKVQLQRPVQPPEADESGAWKENWETIDEVRCRVYDLSGGELFQARQVVADVSVEVHLRYRKGLSPEWRLKQLVPVERTLHIAAVLNPDGRNHWHCLLCRT